jgi:SnoaL-like domain
MDDAVRQIIDRCEIIDLSTRYCTALDTRDWDLLRSCFTPGSTADFGPWGHAEGVEAIVAAARPVMEGMDATQHLVANHTVAIDGDRASMRCVLVAEHLLVGSAAGTVSTTRGVYEDSLVRSELGWRIAHRTLVVTWREGNTGIFDEAFSRFTSNESATKQSGG